MLRSTVDPTVSRLLIDLFCCGGNTGTGLGVGEKNLIHGHHLNTDAYVVLRLDEQDPAKGPSIPGQHHDINGEAAAYIHPFNRDWKGHGLDLGVSGGVELSVGAYKGEILHDVRPTMKEALKLPPIPHWAEKQIADSARTGPVVAFQRQPSISCAVSEGAMGFGEFCDVRVPLLRVKKLGGATLDVSEWAGPGSNPYKLRGSANNDHSVSVDYEPPASWEEKAGKLSNKLLRSVTSAFHK